MITTSSHRTHHALHLHLEEQGGKLTYGDSGFHRKHVELQVTCFIENIENGLFIG